MQTFEKATAVPVSAERLYEWHMRPGALEDLVPPGQQVDILEEPDELCEGAELTMKVYFGPIGVRWVAHHRDFIDGRQFVDEQIEGPFRSWVHTHRFEPDGSDRSVLRDHVEYELPLGSVGELFGSWISERMLEDMFDYRHSFTRRAVGGSGD